MNLQTHIKAELWTAVSNTYSSGNYSHAILDAVHYLTDVIREKVASDADGAALVGQALGGDEPLLRINRLQTETEKSEQRGFEEILRGVYRAIRNPRSHEQSKDDRDTADAIIIFINYLVNVLDTSKEPYTIGSFIERVFDPDFVESEQYAELLVEEIPKGKRFDTLIEIYRRKLEGNGKIIAYAIQALLQHLSETQIENFLAIVSDELKSTSFEKEIHYTLQLLPPEMWSKISPVARIRIENKLLKSISRGKVYRNSRSCNQEGVLGAWARDFLPHFSSMSEVCLILVQKLESENINDRHYVARYFMRTLPNVLNSCNVIDRFIEAIASGIENDDVDLCEILIDVIRYYPDDWQRKFAADLEYLTDPEYPAVYLFDGTPFLRSELENDEYKEYDLPTNDTTDLPF